MLSPRSLIHHFITQPRGCAFCWHPLFLPVSRRKGTIAVCYCHDMLFPIKDGGRQSLMWWFYTWLGKVCVWLRVINSTETTPLIRHLVFQFCAGYALLCLYHTYRINTGRKRSSSAVWNEFIIFCLATSTYSSPFESLANGVGSEEDLETNFQWHHREAVEAKIKMSGNL